MNDGSFEIMCGIPRTKFVLPKYIVKMINYLPGQIYFKRYMTSIVKMDGYEFGVLTFVKMAHSFPC